MTKWEYKIARENPDRGEEGEKWLNAFGADGWEMISHRLVHEFYNEYLFKRPLVKVQAYDWVMWDGGSCPVDDDTRVEYALSNGKKLTYVASGLDWKHYPDSDSNIVKYRVLA